MLGELNPPLLLRRVPQETTRKLLLTGANIHYPLFDRAYIVVGLLQVLSPTLRYRSLIEIEQTTLEI